jgi:hypothetical protein
MMMLFVVLCKVLAYTSPALVEIMPAKLIAETCMFWEKLKSCFPLRAFQGLL